MKAGRRIAEFLLVWIVHMVQLAGLIALLHWPWPREKFGPDLGIGLVFFPGLLLCLGILITVLHLLRLLGLGGKPPPPPPSSTSPPPSSIWS